MPSVTESLDQAQYLTFSLAGEEYALPILRVKEIIEYEPPTKVPMMPSTVRGVINVRGSVVPVLDLAVKFGLPQGPTTKRTCIVIVEVDIEGQRSIMGVVADAVSEVRELAADDIEPPPAFGTRVRVDFLHGMGKIGRKFVLILEVDRVLSPGEWLVVEHPLPVPEAPPPEAAAS